MTETEKKEHVGRMSGLAEVLRRTGSVTPAQLDEAHAFAVYKGMQLGQALIALGHLTPERLDWALKMQEGLRSGNRKAQKTLVEFVDASMAAASMALTKWARD